MLKAEIEFDNLIALPQSPQEYIQKNVFRNNVVLKEASNDGGLHNETYEVLMADKDNPTNLYPAMEIRLKNIKQI